MSHERRFEIIRKLGAGGMGVVFEAHDRLRGQRVALKTVRKVDPTTLTLFKREFRLLASLRHPNLVTLGELVHEGGRWFFTMELVEGSDFRSYCAASSRSSSPSPPLPSDTTTRADREDPTLTEPPPPVSAPRSSSDERGRPDRFDEERLREALGGLCRGLVALHDAGRVHRDLKPANVLVTATGRVVLLDFGLVAQVGDVGSVRSGHPWGTPRYMAPESLIGRIGPASDVYAVGVMLYDVLAGRPPFGGSGEPLLIAKSLREAAPPSVWSPDVPTDLEALVMRMLRRDPEERPTAVEILVALGARTDRAPRLPLLARERELGVLDRVLDDVIRTRAPIVCTCVAEAGLGKTRLLESWLDRARERRELLVLSGTSYEDAAVPFAALDAAVDTLAEHLAETPSDNAALAAALSIAARVFPVLARPVLEAAGPARSRFEPSEGDRSAAFEALATTFRLVARERPIVLVLDDAHWADADSSLLLSSLLNGPSLGAVLVVIAHRPAVGALALLAALALTDVPHVAIELLPLDRSLSPSDVAALSSAFGEVGSPLDVEALLRASEGRPLDLIELLRHHERARLGHDADGMAASQGASTTFERALGRRLGQLSPAARDLLAVVALSRSPLPLPVASLACRPRGAGDAQRARDDLLAAGLVRVGGALGPAGVEVVHDRVRSIVLASLGSDEVRALHQDVAAAMRCELPGATDRIAEHLTAAGDFAAAEPFLLRAAEAARESLAYARAADLYRRAVAGRAPDDPRRTALLVVLGDAESLAGRGLAASRAYLEAAPQVDRATKQDLERRAAEQLLMSGRQREGMRVLRGVCREVGLPAPTTPLTALPYFLVERARLLARGPHEGDPSAPRGPNVDLRVNAARSAARSLSIVDTMTSAYYQTLHLRLSLETGDPAHLLYAYALSAGFAAAEEGGGGARTAHFLERNRELGARCRDPLGPATLALAECVVAYCSGRFGACVAWSERALDQYRDVGGDCSWDVGTARTFRFIALGFTGQLATLAGEAEEAQREADLRNDLYTTSFFQTGAVPWVDLAAGDVSAARERLIAAVERHRFPGFSWGWFLSRLHLALLAIQADEPAEAHRVLDELRAPPVPLLIAGFRLHRILATWTRGAVAARALERRPRSLLERAWITWAVASLRRDGEPHALALAESLDAALFVAAGRRGEAHRAWVSATTGFAAAGWTLFAAAAHARAAATTGERTPVGLVHRAAAERLFVACHVPSPAAVTATLMPGLRTAYRSLE